MHDPKISEMPRLEQVIKGIKKEYAKQCPGQRVRLPITPEILLKMRQVWDCNPKDFDSIMMWAACCLCFFGFLRAGEISVPSEAAYDKGEHLNFSDVAIDNLSNPRVLKVKIKASKTDPFRKGVEICVGKTDNKLCPVTAMLAYLARRGQEDGMLFKFEDGKLLTRERFVTRVRAALTAAGIDCKPYSGHSFRIGAATAAGKKGLLPATIKTLGRWEELVGVSKLISQP